MSKAPEEHFVPFRVRIEAVEERVRNVEGRAQELCARIERAQMSLREALVLIGRALASLPGNDPA